MSNSPKKAAFSVLMSLYINEKAEYFDACMESVTAQTVLPSEIVIIKDGPVSDEVEVALQKWCEAYPELLHVVAYTPNRGLGYALSVGVEVCSCELIARMDTDDIAREDRFEKQLAEFEKNPKLDICGSYIDEFEGEPNHIVSQRTVPLLDADIKRYQKRRSAFNHMSVMFKKSAVLKAGNYQTCMLIEDTFLWVRMIQSGAVCANIPEPLVNVRIGKAMYERRGGFVYFLKYREGRKKVRETGYISAWDYYYTLAVQLAVSLMPSGVRGWIFKHALHRGKKA